MIDSERLMGALDARVERRQQRRAFFTAAVGAAAVGAGAFAFASAADAQTVTDADVLNFALNLEYLEANFYSYAVFGTPIDASMTDGSGNNGYAMSATYNAGARAVKFTDPLVSQYAREIAADEIAHVKFLRSALGAAGRVSQPVVDVGVGANNAFSMAAQAAKVVGAGGVFDPYASDEAFLLGAFIFEDVGVTAYKGASVLLTNKTYLEAAAGILAVEAYHASIVRTVLTAKGIGTATTAAQPDLITNAGKISDARDSLDGSSDDDQGIALVSTANGDATNIVPTDSNSIAYSRTAANVLNIVYLTSAQATMGGFFPAGVNGTIATSTANG